MHRTLLFTIALAPTIAFSQFTPETIDSSIEIGYGLAIGDVNGDAKPDILLADKNEIVWYANPTWEKHVMARNLTLRDNVCIAAADINNDGIVEVAVGANWNPSETTSEKTSGAVFYLVRPIDVTQPWQPVQLPEHEPTVHRMVWLPTKGIHQLAVLPLHGRDNVKGTGENGVVIRTYLHPKDPAKTTNPALWQVSTLPGGMHQTHNFDIAQPEGAPPSLLVGGLEGIQISSENPKYPAMENITTPDGVGEIRPGPRFTHRGNDLTSYATIEPIHGNRVTVYDRSHIADGQYQWSSSLLDDTLAQGHALACGDLLGTDRAQVVAGWRKPDANGQTGIKLYTWTGSDHGNPTDGQWKSHLISNKIACEDLKLADLDGDGKLDIIACGRSTKNVLILWNNSEPEPAPALAEGWKKHEIFVAEKGSIPSAIPADYDGDGHVDVMIGAQTGDHLILGPDFKEQILVRKLTPGQQSRGIHNTAFDIDHDGDIDFIAGARAVYYIENPGHKAARGQWKYHLLDGDINGVHCVMPADVDLDGKPDLIVNEFRQPSSGAKFPDSIAWQSYTPQIASDTPFHRNFIAQGDAPGGNHYMGFGDINGDGLPDVSCGAKGHGFEAEDGTHLGHWFAWWQHPGVDNLNEPWKRVWFSQEHIGATCIQPADLDGDGDNDLFATRGHGSGVLWFENTDGTGLNLTPHEIDPRLSRPHCLTVADIDGDGDIDAATCAIRDRRTVWYENDGNGNFTPHDIDDDQGAYDIHAIDMDGDGDVDLLVAGQGDANVVWYENE